MTGCVSVSLSIGSAGQDRCTPSYHDNDDFTTLKSCLRTAELSRGQFFKVSAERRNVVVCEFGLLRDAVDAQERAALIEFDDYVRHGMKVLETEYQALQVKLWQLAAYYRGGLASPNMSTDESEFANYGLLAPYFHLEGIQILRGIGKYWSVSNATNQAALEKTQCCLLAQMRQFVTEATEDVSMATFRKYASMQPIKTSFQGQKVATINLNKFRQIGCIQAHDIGGMAVNADGSLFAIADAPSEIIHLVSLVKDKTCGLDWDSEIAFKSPSRLCFGPNGKSLLVSTQKLLCVEISLRGKHIRRINHLIANPTAVDANSEIIVVCGGPIIHVLDYRSGTLLRKVSSENTVTDCVSVKLSLDGSCFVVAQSSPQLLSIFTIEGVFLTQILSSVSFPRYVTCLPSGEIAVIGRTVGDHSIFAIYSGDCVHGYQLAKHVEIHHPLPSIIPCLFNVGDSLCAFTKNEMQIFF